MIRFYAYYSFCGGYDERFLGDSSMTSDYTYLLAYKVDEEIRQKYNLIETLTKDNRCLLPDEAGKFMFNAGYKVAYSMLSTGEACLTLRDIDKVQEDSIARRNKFTMTIIATKEGDDDTDIKKLDAYAMYVLNHSDEVYENAMNLFSYEIKLQGVSFAIKRLLAEIDSLYNNATEAIEHVPGRVAYLLLESKKALKPVMQNLRIEKTEEIGYILGLDGSSYGTIKKTPLPKPLEHTESDAELIESYSRLINDLRDCIVDSRNEILQKILDKIKELTATVETLSSQANQPAVRPLVRIGSLAITGKDLIIAGVSLIVGVVVGALLF